MSPSDKKSDSIELVKPASRSPLNPPRVLNHILHQSLDSCSQLLEHMFSATDDLFYDLSKRASSNNEENLYFESMREIRIKKHGVITRFLRGISESFNDLILNKPIQKPSEHDDEVHLSIVEGDELEVELAHKNMSGRTRETYKEELYELGIRLDHLLLQVNVSEDNNPLDPNQISQAFIASCSEQLQVSIKARLILFKLFEKHVLKQLGHIYADANQVLVEAGILPKVPRNLGKSRSAQAPHDGQGETQSEQEAASPAADAAPGQQPVHFNLDINTLSNLMASARMAQGSMFSANGVPNASGYTYYLYSSNPGPVMQPPELSSLLTKTQPLVDRQLAGDEPRNIVADIINQLLAKRDPEVPQALEQTEEDVINLVAMFFDKVLEDENLPIAVQSLICRLQIPILKVALHDQRFLVDGDHPARQLINSITQAGIGFDESKPLERDPLYRVIVDGVQNINRQYKNDLSIFTEVQNEIEAFINNEKRKANIVEKRTTQTETGKSKIKSARLTSQSALYEKMKEAELPDEISTFLTSTWLQVLVITLLKFGKGSPQWVEMEQLVSDLIWLCQPKTDERSIARKARLQPEILQRIEMGLETAIDNPESRSTKIGIIESTLARLDEENGIEVVEYRSLNIEQKEALGKSESSEKPWEDMTALERQQSKYEELSSKYYNMAKNITEGTWLEYFDQDSGRQVRCKLSAKIDAETYIFVNRFGLKTLEKTRRQFAYDLQFEKAKSLDSRPLFERLMEKVVDGLKTN